MRLYVYVPGWKTATAKNNLIQCMYWNNLGKYLKKKCIHHFIDLTIILCWSRPLKTFNRGMPGRDQTKGIGHTSNVLPSICSHFDLCLFTVQPLILPLPHASLLFLHHLTSSTHPSIYPFNLKSTSFPVAAVVIYLFSHPSLHTRAVFILTVLLK